MASSTQAPLTVYFDGACPVCSREVALYRREPQADAICWVDASGCDALALGADLARPQALARLHVRTPDGALVSGARAFTTLWRHLPRWAWLGRLLSPAPVVAVLEIGYRLFLSVRRLWRGAPGSAA